MNKPNFGSLKRLTLALGALNGKRPCPRDELRGRYESMVCPAFPGMMDLPPLIDHHNGRVREVEQPRKPPILVHQAANAWLRTAAFCFRRGRWEDHAHPAIPLLECGHLALQLPDVGVACLTFATMHHDDRGRTTSGRLNGQRIAVRPRGQRKARKAPVRVDQVTTIE
jgi:hypothetical protein